MLYPLKINKPYSTHYLLNTNTDIHCITMCCLLLFIMYVLLHCSIGYPMVTLGFACKTYITCMIQQVRLSVCVSVYLDVYWSV